MNILEVITKFKSQKNCIKYLEQKRWNGKPICPYCKSENTNSLPKELRHHCNGCRKSFSVRIGTIFDDTRVPLNKWFMVIALMLNAKKSISACQVARDLGMRRPTIWSMMHRVRLAMKEDKKFLEGIVEVDETYIGGKPRANEHKKRKKDDDENGSNGVSSSGSDKSVVLGMIERGGKIKAMKVDNTKRDTLMKEVLENIAKGSEVMTDDNKAYYYMYVNYQHKAINHSALQYVKGKIHTNTIEGFWSLLKRGIKGQFHHISKKYMNKYVNEFCWRFNNRKNDCAFDNLVGNMLLTS